MGEIRFVGIGETRGYPYLVCKKFIFLHKNIFCDPSLEPSSPDGSNEGPQHMFVLRNKKNYL